MRGRQVRHSGALGGSPVQLPMGGRAEGLGARIAPHRLSRAAGTADNIASRSNCRRWNRVIMCCCSSPSERGHTQQEAELELQHLVMTSTSVVGANRSHFSNSSLGTVSVLSLMQSRPMQRAPNRSKAPFHATLHSGMSWVPGPLRPSLAWGGGSVIRPLLGTQHRRQHPCTERPPPSGGNALLPPSLLTQPPSITWQPHIHLPMPLASRGALGDIGL